MNEFEFRRALVVLVLRILTCCLRRCCGLPGVTIAVATWREATFPVPGLSLTA